MRAQFSTVGQDKERNIVFIEDIANHTGGTTITNDAEAVFRYWAQVLGNDVRVVYRDTDNEWWEIIENDHAWSGSEISFRPWYGEVWDRLSRIES